MPVKHGVDTKTVDRLLQSARAEKCKNLRVFAYNGRTDGGVMKHSDFRVGLQFGQGLLKLYRMIDRFLATSAGGLRPPSNRRTYVATAP